jgi:beta-galactosidase
LQSTIKDCKRHLKHNKRFLRKLGFACGISHALAAGVDWNSGWFFSSDGAGSWRAVVLPHDWSIESPVSKDAPSLGGGGFFQTGTGWYRRDFDAPASWRDRRVVVEFEGVYMNAEVRLNGAVVARQPYGYSSFFAELTPHLRIGEKNTLLVRADNSAQPNCRWFSGSGIYRPVRLHVTAPVRVVPWGVFVATTRLDAESASIRVEATVANGGESAAGVSVETVITDPDGREVARAGAEGRAAAGADFTAAATATLANPRPWSPETPVLYRAVTRVRSGGGVVDEVVTPFGVRTVRVSAERGFELNGRPLKLAGGNVHHDHGPLGAAAFARAEERKVELLKAAGFNAARTSHNPPSPAFLDACDRLGLLVMDEAFDGWARNKTAQDYGLHFDDWWRRDLDAMVLRDRNHPSIVLWSIGNEMFERGNADGLRIAHALTRRIRELDTTRPVTAGVNGMGKGGEWSQLDPLFAVLDAAGYNYELAARHAADHERLPHRVIVAAESYLSETFANWSAAHDHAHVIGDFVWSAIDYLGEAGIGRVFPPGEPIVRHWEGDQWPWHGAACGDIDLTGLRKPGSHYRNIVWDRGEKLHVAVAAPAPGGGEWGVSPWAPAPVQAHWTWPGHEGEPLAVEVYSRYDTVRLYLNGGLVGEKPATRAEEFKAVFSVPYAPGKLEAAGVRDGREAERFALVTAGAPARLRLTPDRGRIAADGQDLSFVVVEVLDAGGVVAPAAGHSVRYTLDGPATLAGIGSADLTDGDSYRANPRRVFQGRALVVVRAGDKAGAVKLTASAPGLPPAEITLYTESSR